MSKDLEQKKNKRRQKRRKKIYPSNDKQSTRKAVSLKREKDTLQELIIQHFRQYPNSHFSSEVVCQSLGVSKRKYVEQVQNKLFDLKKSGILISRQKGTYTLNINDGYVRGVLHVPKREIPYVLNENGGEPIEVMENDIPHAQDGDEVEVRLFASRKNYPQQGEIVGIIKRKKEMYVGTLHKKNNLVYVSPTGRYRFDILLALKEGKKGKNGDKVIAQITEWNDGSNNPSGTIIEVLGSQGEHNTEMHAILAEFDIPHRYPAEVEKEAKEIEPGITLEEIEKRRDFRNITTFTIDPADAKDFDDALSFLVLENGHYEVGIHIADVTHYVTPNSMMEEEAQDRTTSIYLVDRTIPMLPEHISNYICSLRPNEEKLTFSAVFELNEKGKVLQEWYGKTIIYSDKRFTYEEAQEIIESQEGNYSAELLKLNKLAQTLKRERVAKGSVSFETTEIRFNLDEDGTPLSVVIKESKEAHKLIEEFMLLANKRVAQKIYKMGNSKKKAPFVYRVHDLPDKEKLARLARFVSHFGHHLNTETPESTAHSLNKLLDESTGKSYAYTFQNLAIRSMSRAEYTTENIGHYGLAFEHYTHFTSPIRRYPDMMVHRLLQKYLDGKPVKYDQRLEKLCKRSSELEVRAMQAERASIKYKQVEYMSQFIGEVFTGHISGLTEWGLYVEIDVNRCEGMIAMRHLPGDYYVYDEKNYCLVGRRTKKRFNFGDEMKIQVVKANIEKRMLDFVPAETDQ